MFISVTILNKRCDFIIYQGMDDFDKNSAAYFNAQKTMDCKHYALPQNFFKDLYSNTLAPWDKF